MSFLLSPPTGPRQDTPGDDGLDTLLRAFYKAERPDPWPSFEAPADQRVLLALSPTPRRPQPLLRSRLALAASVALLVAGPWLLDGALKPTAGTVPANPVVSNPPLGQPTADKRNGQPPVSEPEPKLPMKVAPFESSDWPN
jgi:hypothetical protein